MYEMRRNKMYLIEWRADYVANDPKKAIASRTIKDVKWAYQQPDDKLKMGLTVSAKI